jgi:hypothetical protein
MGNFGEDIDASTFYPSAYQYDRSKVKVCNAMTNTDDPGSHLASGWSLRIRQTVSPRDIRPVIVEVSYDERR